MASDDKRLKMFVIPCSCGTTFAVSENYDRQGTAWSRYLKCPNCEKRHDPKNRCSRSDISAKATGRWMIASWPALPPTKAPPERGSRNNFPQGKDLLYFPTHLTVRLLRL